MKKDAILSRGWHAVAFERELTSELTPVRIAQMSLVLVHTEGQTRAFDAVCPHRGANLGVGGTLIANEIVCPFHGYKVRLGAGDCSGFFVREYRVVRAAGMVFILLDPGFENGFENVLSAFEQEFSFVPSFAFHVRAEPELVIENAFDRRHFMSVHGVAYDPELRQEPSQHGELAVRARLITGTSEWQARIVGTSVCETDFVGRVFSPNACACELRLGDTTFVVVTGATPTQEFGCEVRVSMGWPRDLAIRDASENIKRSLIENTRLALEQDIKIWENISDVCTPSYTSEDDLVLTFRKWCENFRGTAQGF